MFIYCRNKYNYSDSEKDRQALGFTRLTFIDLWLVHHVPAWSADLFRRTTCCQCLRRLCHEIFSSFGRVEWHSSDDEIEQSGRSPKTPSWHCSPPFEPRSTAERGEGGRRIACIETIDDVSIEDCLQQRRWRHWGYRACQINNDSAASNARHPHPLLYSTASSPNPLPPLSSPLSSSCVSYLSVYLYVWLYIVCIQLYVCIYHFISIVLCVCHFEVYIYTSKMCECVNVSLY